MDQDLNNSKNEFLWALLANPANDAHLYAYNLQRLVNDFPQSGILQALLAHASDEKNLRQASVYFNAKSLYKLINAPSTFTGVPDDKIIIQTGIRSNGHYQQDKPLQTEENLFVQPGENVQDAVIDSHADDHRVVESEPEAATGLEDHQIAIADEEDLPAGSSLVDEYHISEAVPEIAENTPIEEPGENIGNEPHEELSADAVTAPQEPELIHDAATEREDIVEAAEDTAAEFHEAVSPETISSHEEPELIHHAVAEDIEPEEAVENKDAEVHEAISAETSSVQEPELIHQAVTEKEEQDEPAYIESAAETEATIGDPEAVEANEQEPEKAIEEETFDEIVGIEDISTGPETNQAAAEHEERKPAADDVEKLVPESIASTDFFMFDKAFGDHKQADQAENVAKASPGSTADTAAADNTDHQDVSKYNDEKMPYTFMWWLDKTRKEHAGAYQPYVKPEGANLSNQPKRATDELQQQYFENIFHITSVDELDKNAPPLTAPYNIKRKEHVIIERFIKEEPQIKPQSSDKIDNENKAKKSSEDRDELVTETLAVIYSDQMLYHKAIASYKKLMLKFPEKSRYFADKIEQLEKKTN